MDTKAMIEKATGGLELVTEGDTSYYKRTTLSLTGLLTISQEQFSSKADSEAFILNSMYSEFYKDYIAKAKKKVKRRVKISSNEAFEATKKFLKMIRQLSINLHTS
jgi:hypothetical protein